MIEGGQSPFGLGVDFAAQAAVLALVVAIATKMYPTIVQ